MVTSKSTGLGSPSVIRDLSRGAVPSTDTPSALDSANRCVSLGVARTLVVSCSCVYVAVETACRDPALCRCYALYSAQLRPRDASSAAVARCSATRAPLECGNRSFTRSDTERTVVETWPHLLAAGFFVPSSAALVRSCVDATSRKNRIKNVAGKISPLQVRSNSCPKKSTLST